MCFEKRQIQRMFVHSFILKYATQSLHLCLSRRPQSFNPLFEDMATDLTKNRGKKRPFMCFRSAGFNSGSVTRSPKDSLRRSMSDNSITITEDDDCLQKKEKPRRRLSRVLKAILFDASLAKRLQSRKPPVNSFASQNNLSSIQSVDGSSNKELLYSESDDVCRVDSTRSSSRYSSTSNIGSLCPNCSCSLPTSPERKLIMSKANYVPATTTAAAKKPPTLLNFGCYSTNRALCLLLSGLMVLIIWGKICAICCTLTWLLFAPRRFNVVQLHAKACDSLPPMDLDRYKT